MDGHRIRPRPARPSVEEGLVFARYVDQAADGFFRFLLGRRSPEIIAAAYTQPAHDLSHEYATFAEREDEILGLASAYSFEQHRLSSDLPLRQAEGYSPLRTALLAGLCAPILRFLDTLDAGDFYLQAIAVDPAHRGEGVGSALIDVVLGRARESGSRRLCLDVASRNEGARRLYERHGMAVVSASPNLFLIPGSKVFRMARDL